MKKEFSKASDYTEQRFTVYDVPKENVTTIMMVYKDTKTMVFSFDDDTDSLTLSLESCKNITLVLLKFIICLNCVSRMSINLMKENGFTHTKKIKR